jgi:hypothetical protein
MKLFIVEIAISGGIVTYKTKADFIQFTPDGIQLCIYIDEEKNIFRIVGIFKDWFRWSEDGYVTS